jgi:transcription elongation factor Elf1
MESRKTQTTADLRKCSNCGEHAPVHQMLSVSSKNRIIALICPACQQAKKIQVTLEKKRGNWKFYQYFPVEA